MTTIVIRTVNQKQKKNKIKNTIQPEPSKLNTRKFAQELLRRRSSATPGSMKLKLIFKLSHKHYSRRIEKFHL